MIRDAELFYLDNIDIQPLIHEIENHKKSHILKLDIGIFTYGSLPDNYIAISTSIIIDEILIRFGAVISPEKNIMSLILPKDPSKAGDLVFGDKSVIIFLPKIE